MATRPPVVNELRDDSQDPEEEDGCDSARESVSESEEVEPQAKLKNSKRMLTSLMLTPEPQQKTQKKENIWTHRGAGPHRAMATVHQRNARR